MGYWVRITNKETKESRDKFYEGTYDESTEYWWKEGNFSCDCNRELEFYRANGEEFEGLHKCGDDRYSVALLPVNAFYSSITLK